MVPLLVVLQDMLRASCCQPHRLWQDLRSRGGASSVSVHNSVHAAAASTYLWPEHTAVARLSLLPRLEHVLLLPDLRQVHMFQARPAIPVTITSAWAARERCSPE
jgi:hypothetical protein